MCTIILTIPDCCSSCRRSTPRAGQDPPMRLASMSVLAKASSLASSVDRGLCMGSFAANLAVESGLDALGVGEVGESDSQHYDHCDVMRNSPLVDRLGST